MALPKTYSPGEIPSIYQCNTNDRKNQTVVSDFDGTLLIDRSSFPYYALIAFDVGGILRLFLLLLATPLIGILYYLISESAGIRVLIFATFAGVRVSSIKSAANVVLPKHYSEDLHPTTWDVFTSFGRKCVLTANPRIMVEPFLKKYLGVDMVIGTEISSYKGIATGFLASPGVLVGKNKAIALRKAFGSDLMPDIGLGDRKTDIPFMKLCKESYIVPPRAGVRPVRSDLLPKPVIFHDGRLVQKPTPLTAFLIILWFLIGVPLSVVRVLVGSLSPISMTARVSQLTGCSIIAKGNPLQNTKDTDSNGKRRGVIFVCSHRSVTDPIFVSASLGLETTTISYSVSRLSEILSPIQTSRLTRDRTKDAQMISKILDEGRYLVMCPEGTTCREPYLLRFSSLFAELTDQIIPVALTTKMSMFHSTTARGYKWLDPFFFMMNPNPTYEITFLDKLMPDQTCSGGNSSHDVANYVQKLIAETLQYKCTNLTRKDKYNELAGTDGIVGQKSVRKVKGG